MCSMRMHGKAFQIENIECFKWSFSKIWGLKNVFNLPHDSTALRLEEMHQYILSKTRKGRGKQD